MDCKDILCLALTAPRRLTREAAAIVVSDLDSQQGDETILIALSALAALLYARPDLVHRSVVASLSRIMVRRPVSRRLLATAAETWRFLATSSLVRPAARALIGLLSHHRLSPVACRTVLSALPAYARWRPDVIDLSAALRAARAMPDAAAR